MCVETTARDAADRGYNVIVGEDATATYYDAHQRAALSAVARVYGQIWKTEEIVTQARLSKSAGSSMSSLSTASRDASESEVGAR
jgi:isochorismate hydrolase